MALFLALLLASVESEMSGSVEEFGSITWWGFTPAVDLTALAQGPGERRGRVWGFCAVLENGRPERAPRVLL